MWRAFLVPCFLMFYMLVCICNLNSSIFFFDIVPIRYGMDVFEDYFKTPF